MDYNVVLANAQSAHDNYLKCGNKNNFNRFVNNMNNFYSEGAKNPSVAKIIMWSDVIRPNYKMNMQKLNTTQNIEKEIPLIHFTPVLQSLFELNCKTMQAITNGLEYLNVSAPILSMMKTPAPIQKRTFDKKFEELYPKTHSIRDILIKRGRVSMDKVQKKSDSWREKVSIASSRDNFYDKYPKTKATRLALFIENRIQDNKVTLKMDFLQKLKFIKNYKIK